MVLYVWAGLALLVIAAYVIGRQRAMQLVEGRAAELHSRPPYYGQFLAIAVAVPALIVLAGWLFAEQPVIKQMITGEVAGFSEFSKPEQQLFMRDVKALATGGIVSTITPEKEAAAETYVRFKTTSDIGLVVAVGAAALLGMVVGFARISPKFRARNSVETIIKAFMIVCSSIAILTTFGIVFSLIFETVRFFEKIPPLDFFTTLQWSPQTAIRPGQVGAEGAFGVIPLLVGTLLITAIAMLVAVPIGLFSAIYLSDYAPARIRAIAKPLLEVLAGIPTVVYGFFAALTVAPLIRNTGESLGLSVSSESALAAGVVMGVMIIPFVSSLSDDVINAVPQSLRDGSFGLGATKSETIRKVILPAALPGIVGAVLLAISRAVGETMIVVMAAGLSANLTINPLDAVTTVTVQIVTLLVGDQEFDSAKTLAAFALGMTLFVMTLGLNIIALRVVQKYREKYD